MRLALTIALAAASLAAVPAAAQTLDELVVTGHALRGSPQSLSETVSYADLDLTVPRQRAILEQRVNAAAGRICDRLNEAPPSPGNLGHSCQEVAVRNASDQLRLAVVDARNMARLGANTPAAGSYAAQASAVAYDAPGMAPIPDTRANRARFGGPMSHAGRASRTDGR